MRREHEGEQAVQAKAGEGGPGWGSPMFDANLSGGFGDFLARQAMLVLAASDADGAMWTTIVTGQPGFARPADARTILIDALPAPGDPLREALQGGADVGIIALEPQTRRRIRVNGLVERRGEGLEIRTEQVLGNCPKYLQTRQIVEYAEDDKPGPAARDAHLTMCQRKWIEAADTFFIGSRSPQHGADASHRGGEPGFVRVDGDTLRWPDYRGNSFYMTLGNLELDDSAGLLFLDWERGGTLQLSGRSRVDWDTAAAAAFPGALRVIEFEVRQIVAIEGASPLRWRLLARSPHNPPACRP